MATSNETKKNETRPGGPLDCLVRRQQTENDMQHREPFWLVWNPQGYNPQCKYNTEEGATREAERLARANPGQTFIVMESVGALVVDNIQRTDLRRKERGNG